MSDYATTQRETRMDRADGRPLSAPAGGAASRSHRGKGKKFEYFSVIRACAVKSCLASFSGLLTWKVHQFRSVEKAEKIPRAERNAGGSQPGSLSEERRRANGALRRAPGLFTDTNITQCGDPEAVGARVCVFPPRLSVLRDKSSEPALYRSAAQQLAVVPHHFV